MARPSNLTNYRILMKKQEILLSSYELLKCWRWTLGLLLFGGAMFYFMFTRELWILLGIPPMKPFFVDQYAILAASDCSQQGFDVFVQNPCDPYNRIHVYSRLWLIFSYLGIHVQHNTFFGVVIVGSFLIATALSIKPKTKYELIVSVLLLSSPAVMLGVERGNSDLIMYTLCVAGVYLLARKNLILKSFAYCFLMHAFFLKLYPVASFIILVEYIKKIKTFYFVTTIVAVFISIYMYVTFNDLVMIVKNIPKPDDLFMTFGSKELLKMLNIKSNIIYISFPLILFSIIIGHYLSDMIKSVNRNINSREILLFLAGAANLCLCFFVNINYHYRCVYLLCCLPYFFRLKEQRVNSTIKMMTYAFYFFMFSIVWAEFFIYWVGDPAIMSMLKMSMMDAIRNIQLLKHTSSWGVSLILLIFLSASIQSSVAEKRQPFTRDAKFPVAPEL